MEGKQQKNKKHSETMRIYESVFIISLKDKLERRVYHDVGWKDSKLRQFDRYYIKPIEKHLTTWWKK